jgi:hypothetical protein
VGRTLVEAGAQSWIVLMKDDRIRYRPRERAALEAARVQAFAPTTATMPGEEQAHLLLTHASRMEQFRAEHPGRSWSASTGSGRSWMVAGRAATCRPVERTDSSQSPVS